jgi:X-Pro dipeptidyl-peptidase
MRTLVTKTLIAASLATALLAAPAGAVVHETLTIPTSVDGATIHVEVARPDGDAKAPIILTYSPYNELNITNTLAATNVADDSLAASFVPKGYARAVADVIGTRDSTGCWDYGGLKEQQSGVDLVNALAKLPWSNGRVAMIGGSYDGTTANMVAARGADVPALRAIVPESAINHWYGYAFQDGVRYFGNTQNPSDEGVDTPLGFDFAIARTPPDQPTDPAFAQALATRYQPCDSVDHTAHGYSSSPDYDDFWLERDYRKDAAKFRAAVLVVHGWQDYNVRQSEGTDMYESLPVDDPRTPAVEGVPFKKLYMFQGPHSGPTGDFEPLLEAFFDHTLKDVANGVEGGVPVITQGRTSDDPTGQDFTAETEWPPPSTGPVAYELGRDATTGTLSVRGSGQPGSFVDLGIQTEELAFSSPTSEGGWLWFQSEPVARDTRIAGSPILQATLTSGSDHGQLDATLADVGADGTPVPVSRGFLNLRYRHGVTKSETMPTGTPFTANVRLAPQDWTVKAGHRLGLYVAGSNLAWALPDQPGAQIAIQPQTRLVLPVVGAAPVSVATRPKRKRKGTQAAVAVSPASGRARATFRVRLRLVEPAPDADPRGDRYRVSLRGPGGAGCGGRLRVSHDYKPTKRAKTLIVGLRAPRKGSGWCRGTYRGTVSFRDRHRSGRTSVRRVGTFTFRVR